MRSTALLVGLGLLAALTGCTQDTPDLPSLTTSTTAPPLANFPIRVLKEGGSLDQQGQLTIASDGGVIATMGSDQVSCAVSDRSALQIINDAAVRIAREKAPSDSPSAAPGTAQVRMGDSQINPVPIDDPRVGAARQAVQLILTDVAEPDTGKRILCR